MNAAGNHDKALRVLRTNALAAAAAIGYLVASAVALATWHVVDEQWSEAAMDRYGRALAEDLAHLSLEPLLNQDRIRLGVLTERLARRPEVRRIAVYTVDNRLFVVAGDAHSADVPTFIRPIAVQDTVAGDVQVALNADRFGLPVVRLLERGWPAILGGLVLVVAVASYVSHAGRQRQRARAEAKNGPVAPVATYMLIANLVAAKGTSSTQTGGTLRRGMAVAERIANLYAGQAELASDSCVLLRFRETSAPERGFEVACAALLLQRLLNGLHRSNGEEPSDPSGDGDPSGAPFRYGLDLSGTGTTNDTGTGPTARVSPFANVLLLSSLAPPGELAIGEAAYEAIDRPGRLKIHALDNPATEALSAGLAVPRGIVRGVSEDYQTLLERQAAVISNAARTDTSPDA